MPIPKITDPPATPTTTAATTEKVAGLVAMTRLSQALGALDSSDAPADLLLKELGLQDPEKIRDEFPSEVLGDTFMLGVLFGIVREQRSRSVAVETVRRPAPRPADADPAARRRHGPRVPELRETHDRLPAAPNLLILVGSSTMNVHDDTTGNGPARSHPSSLSSRYSSLRLS